MKLYTVDRADTLGEGMEIELIKDFNTHTSDLYQEYKKPSGDLLKYYKKNYKEGLSKHGIRYLLTDLNRNIKDCSCEIELFAESFRRGLNKNLPSRFQSFYSVYNLEDVENFITYQGGGDNCIVYDIEVDEVNVFKADMHLLNLGGSNLEAEYNINRYWNGEGSQNPFWEFLIKPPFKIGKKIEGNTKGWANNYC